MTTKLDKFDAETFTMALQELATLGKSLADEACAKHLPEPYIIHTLETLAAEYKEVHRVVMMYAEDAPNES